jgi:hypothetical protein
MDKKISLLLIIIIFSLTLSACNMPRPNQTPTGAADSVGTYAAETVAAFSTQLAAQVTPSLAVETPQPTTAATQTQSVPQPTNQSAASPTTTSVPCDRAEFVSDVTVPDGTKIGPGTSFVKTWRLKNTGSCTWTTSYRVVFDSGNALGAPASFNLPTNVPPNGIADISVNMKAPDSPKDYESFWKLQNAAGITFGLGSNADNAFWVKISVGSTPAPFAITKVTISVDNADVSAACPHKFKLAAEITSTSAGKVTYFWERSDGSKTATSEVNFDNAGSKSVSYEWEFNSTFDGSVRVYIDNPNHQYFSPFNLKLSCTP